MESASPHPVTSCSTRTNSKSQLRTWHQIFKPQRLLTRQHLRSTVREHMTAKRAKPRTLTFHSPSCTSTPHTTVEDHWSPTKGTTTPAASQFPPLVRPTASRTRISPRQNQFLQLMDASIDAQLGAAQSGTEQSGGTISQLTLHWNKCSYRGTN